MDLNFDLPVYGMGVRHVQVALIFFMVVIMYIINMSTPVGIVAMTDPGTSSNPKVPSFPNWTDQSLVLTAFYVGFAPTQLLGGPLARKYGYKWIMIISMLICSLLSLIMPHITVLYGSKGLMVCYFLQGLLQGTVIPMLAYFISNWAPVNERTTLGTFIFASKTLGTVFATETTGLLSSSWWGWPSTFYLYGALGIIWSIFMIIFGCGDPNEHKSITQGELEYINRGKNMTKKKIPWSKILRSWPTWSIWVAHCGVMWTIRLSTTEFPTYMNHVLGFSVETSSNVLAVTYLAAYGNTFLLSNVSKYLITHNYLSVEQCRKICNSIASWGSAFLLLSLALFQFQGYLGLIIVFFVFICTNSSYAGYNINYNDISPNFSAIIYGAGGMSATIISFIPTTLVQFMVTDLADASQWGYAFLISALVTSLSNVFFLIYGKGDAVDYDDSEDIEVSDEESQNLLKK